METMQWQWSAEQTAATACEHLIIFTVLEALGQTSLTGFGGGTMCSLGDVYRIHLGSEIAHWKNLSVGHQACFHWAGSHSMRLAGLATSCEWP